jgi:hypothetical protein
MLLLSNLKMQEKKRLCHIIAKVYLLRWRGKHFPCRAKGMLQKDIWNAQICLLCVGLCGRMNNIRASAMEIVSKELIYA